MVEQQIRARGISDPAVLSAMLRVPRHLFVEEESRYRAYSDAALPIRENQTISQPYIVSLMSENAQLNSTDRVLEIGTGSGYQAAVLGEIAREVYTIEIVESLAQQAKRKLADLNYTNIHVKHGDGYQGWPEQAPFDAILITAATPEIPKPLVEQLKEGGRIVLPLGDKPFSQDLLRITKTSKGLKKEYLAGVVFVPMTGEVRK